jgi:hypothetical protein
VPFATLRKKILAPRRDLRRFSIIAGLGPVGRDGPGPPGDEESAVSGYGEAAFVYIALSTAIGVMGRRRKFGAWGYFFASLALTPLFGLLLLLASDVRPRT